MYLKDQRESVLYLPYVTEFSKTHHLHTNKVSIAYLSQVNVGAIEES